MSKLTFFTLWAALFSMVQSCSQQFKPTVISSDISNIQNLYFIVSAKDLPSKDLNKGVADPFAKVYYGIIPPNLKKNNLEGFDKIGISEKLDNNPNPKWNTVFKLPYEKDSQKKLWIEITDHDPINPDDIIGDAFINLEEYISHNYNITTPIWGTNVTRTGSVTVQQTQPFLFTLEIKDVPHLDEFHGLSDPYVKCYFLYEDEQEHGKGTKFYETVPLQNTENGIWENPIPFDHYQNGTNQSIRFKVKDYDSITVDDNIGDAVFDVDPFVQSKAIHTLTLSNTNNATLIVRFLENKV